MTDNNTLNGQAGKNQTEDKKFKVIFEGKIKENTSAPEVKQKIASLFQIDLPGAESIFAEIPRTLRSNLSLNTAYKYKTAFEQTGALCVIEEMEELSPKEETVPKLESAPASPEPTLPAPEHPPSQTPEIPPPIEPTPTTPEPEPPPEIETLPPLEPTPPPKEVPFSPKEIPAEPETEPPEPGPFPEIETLPPLEPTPPPKEVPFSPKKIPAEPETEPPEPGPFPEIETLPPLEPTPPPKEVPFSPKKIPAAPEPEPPSEPEPGPPLELIHEPPSEPDPGPSLEPTPFTPEPPPPIDPSLPEKETPGIESTSHLRPEEPLPPGAAPPPPGKTPPIQESVPRVTPHVKIPEIKRESSFKRLVPLIVILGILVLVVFFIFKPGKTGEKKEARISVTPEVQTSEEADKPGEPTIQSAEIETFTDPNGFYSLSLPKGYTRTDDSSFERSKISFTYPDRTSISLVAHPMKEEWKAEEEMKKKVKEIESGRAGTLSLYRVTNYKLIKIADAPGYDLLLERTGILSHFYYLVDPGKNAVSITLVCEGTDRQDKHDYLVKTIEESLEIF